MNIYTMVITEVCTRSIYGSIVVLIADAGASSEKGWDILGTFYYVSFLCVYV